MNRFEKKNSEVLHQINVSRSQHVAILYSNKKVIKVETNEAGFHAEEKILQTANKWKHKKQLRLYVTKIGGMHRLSRPCWACSKKLRQVPHLRVFYTERDGNWKEDHALDSRHLSLRDFSNLLFETKICHNPPRAILTEENITITNVSEAMKRYMNI